MRKPLPFLLAIGLAVCLLVIAGGAIYAQSGEGEPGILRNPLNSYGGADPWLTYYEGNYYLATTTGGSEWLMRSSPTLAGLKTAMPVQIYAETDPARCCNFWAPEFYLLDGPHGPRWYFYYSAGTSGTLDNQHTHVLESAGTDPMGPYTYKGRLFDPQNDVWAIDGSILKIDESLYFLFSSWVGNNQSLFIAPMSDPWTLSGPRVLISEPEFDWERRGLNVNEGPVALYHDDDIFIVYSASYCATPDYKLGMLIYNGDDPLRADSWDKNPEPVFQRSDENGVFGPGHNGFFRSPDGTENWIVYHANDSVSGACDQGRTTRVQKFTWNEDGTPNFGVPVSTTEEIAAPSGDEGVDPILVASKFRSYSRTARYISYSGSYVQLGSGDADEAQFLIVPGLADPDAVSITTLTGYYLRHQGNALYFHANNNSDDFAADTTWYLRPGLADEAGISFESYNQPGMYIGRQFGTLALVALTDESPLAAREDATFIEEFVGLTEVPEPLPAEDAFMYLELTGSVRQIHDPVIIKADDTYYTFSTHGGIYIRKSSDLLNWESPSPSSVFDPADAPAWTREMVPGSNNDIWAPDISYFNDKFHLYYSVSTFGSNRSVIGLATNVTLNAESEDYEWVDEGLVIESVRSNNYNAIDPNVIIDADGVPWLSFGSFWSGIKMCRLDYETGKLSEEDETLYSLARRTENSGAVEAPFIIRKGDFYYLFVSFDFCCRGADSTYHVRVGRSAVVTGPYVDRDGVDLMDGGGTQVTFPTLRWRGPGHNAILQDGDVEYIVHHAYDADNGGVETLRIAPLMWDEDGWPSLTPLE